MSRLLSMASRDGPRYFWLKQALNDKEMSGILFDTKKWDGACYHAQQALEKLLKFVISDAGEAPKYTHALYELADHIHKITGKTVFDDDFIDRLREVSQYNTVARYPSEVGAPIDLITKRQAREALAVIERAEQILESLYQSDEPNPESQSEEEATGYRPA